MASGSRTRLRLRLRSLPRTAPGRRPGSGTMDYMPTYGARNDYQGSQPARFSRQRERVIIAASGSVESAELAPLERVSRLFSAAAASRILRILVR